MAGTNADLHARIDELDGKIKAQMAKLELHGLFAREHQITEKELRALWAELQSEIHAQMHDDEVLHGKADWLQQEIFKWVSAVDLNYKA